MSWTRALIHTGVCGLGIIPYLALTPPSLAGIATDAGSVPDRIVYQGYLSARNGMPIDASIDITFRLCTDPLTNPCPQVWSETQTVVVSQGLLNVELGAVAPLTVPADFVRELWLELEIAGEGEPMLPRQRLALAPYAAQSVNADTVDGVDASILDQSAHVSDTANPHAVAPGQIGAATSADIINHASSSGAHHAKTTSFTELTDLAAETQISSAITRDTEILPVVLDNDGAGSGVDADLLDGQHASTFMSSTADAWVDTTGDVMTGNLTISGTNRLGIGITPSFPLHVDGDAKLGNRVLFGSSEFIEDGGESTISTGENSLEVGGKIVIGESIQFADGTSQGTAAAMRVSSQVVVAQSGGDFSSIQSAIDAITPTADNPFIVEVMPGTYVESVSLKSFIHLKGAGRDLTTLIPDTDNATVEKDFAAIWLDNLSGVTITGFTFSGGDPTGSPCCGSAGIYDLGSSPMIRNNRFIHFVDRTLSDGESGIFSEASTPQFTGNEFIANGFAGIKLRDVDHSTGSANLFDRNGGCGICADDASFVAIGNQFLENAGGIRASGADNDVVISGNRFVDNTDAIEVSAACTQISGNYISQSFSAQGDGYGISLSPGTGFCQNVVGNTIRGHRTGIYHEGSVVIVGNQLVAGDRAICARGAPDCQDASGQSNIFANYYSLNAAETVPPVESINLKRGIRLTSRDGAISLNAKGTEIIISATGEVSVNASRDVSVNAGGNLSLNAAGNLSLAGDSVSVRSADDMLIDVGGNQAVAIGGTQSVSVGKDQSVQVGQSHNLTAADEISLTTGQAAATMMKNGDLSLSGKATSIRSSGPLQIQGSSINLN